jgi:hypothetical protein
MNITGWIILIVANILVFVLIGSVFFKGWDDFGEGIWFFFKPNLISLLQGEYWEDVWATLRLVIFLALCAALVWAEGTYIVKPYVLPLF